MQPSDPHQRQPAPTLPLSRAHAPTPTADRATTGKAILDRVRPRHTCVDEPGRITRHSQGNTLLPSPRHGGPWSCLDTNPGDKPHPPTPDYPHRKVVPGPPAPKQQGPTKHWTPRQARVAPLSSPLHRDQGAQHTQGPQRSKTPREAPDPPKCQVPGHQQPAQPSTPQDTRAEDTQGGQQG
jgi:hypothetical protein